MATTIDSAATTTSFGRMPPPPMAHDPELVRDYPVLAWQDEDGSFGYGPLTYEFVGWNFDAMGDLQHAMLAKLETIKDSRLSKARLELANFIELFDLSRLGGDTSGCCSA